MAQEYLMEDDRLHEDLRDIKIYLIAHKKEYGNNFDLGEHVARFSPLDKVLAVTPVFLYDNPEVIKKYPHGFHTENAVFIEASRFKSTYENYDKDVSEEQLGLTRALIASALLDLIEDTYHTYFSDEERIKIGDTLFKNSGVNTKEVMLAHPKTAALGVNELEEVAAAAGIPSMNRDYEEMFGVSTQSLNDALFKTASVHNMESPLNKLAQQVISRKYHDVIDNLEPTPEEFEKKYGQGMGSESKAYANAVTNHLVKKAIGNNGEKLTGDQLIENLKEKWIPLLNILTDESFAYTLNQLVVGINEKYPRFDERYQVFGATTIDKIASEYQITKYLTDEKVYIFSSIMSGAASYANFNSSVESVSEKIRKEEETQKKPSM